MIFKLNEGMRKYSSFVIPAILVALSLTSLPVTQAAPTARAGAICSKKGTIQIVGAKKFTCNAVGKKLLWDKGTIISKMPSSATKPAAPNPVESAKPVVADTKWYAWSFRYNDAGVLERKQSGTTSWSTSASRPGQVIDPIRLKAFQEISKYSNPKVRIPISINFYFSPNVNKEVEKLYRKYFNVSIAQFESKIPQGSSLDVVIGTELDDGFFQQSFEKSLGSASEANDLFQRSKGMIHQFDGENGKNSSGGGSVSGTSKSSHFMYVGAVCSCFIAENVLMYNVAHETTHFYQFATTPTTKKQNFVGTWPDVVEGKIYMPNSLMEGSANTLGSALIVAHPGWYSDQMDWHLGRMKSRSVVKEITSESQAIELMNMVRSYMPEKSGYSELNYGLGELIWEYFIAEYGMDAYFNLFTNIQSLGDFDLAMKASINKGEEAFYKEAAPYVMKAYNAVTA